jgi:hypothetical protein
MSSYKRGSFGESATKFIAKYFGIPSFLSVLQPWVHLGLLDNQSTLLMFRYSFLPVGATALGAPWPPRQPVYTAKHFGINTHKVLSSKVATNFSESLFTQFHN